MVYSEYKRMRILHYHFQGLKPPAIARSLGAERLTASRRGVANFLLKYRETGCIGRRPGSGRPSKVTREVKRVVEEQIRTDDKTTTAHQLHVLLKSKGFNLSLCIILRCRTSLGWSAMPTMKRGWSGRKTISTRTGRTWYGLMNAQCSCNSIAGSAAASVGKDWKTNQGMLCPKIGIGPAGPLIFGPKLTCA